MNPNGPRHLFSTDMPIEDARDRAGDIHHNLQGSFFGALRIQSQRHPKPNKLISRPIAQHPKSSLQRFSSRVLDMSCSHTRRKSQRVETSERRTRMSTCGCRTTENWSCRDLAESFKQNSSVLAVAAIWK